MTSNLQNINFNNIQLMQKEYKLKKIGKYSKKNPIIEYRKGLHFFDLHTHIENINSSKNTPLEKIKELIKGVIFLNPTINRKTIKDIYNISSLIHLSLPAYNEISESEVDKILSSQYSIEFPPNNLIRYVVNKDLNLSPIECVKLIMNHRNKRYSTISSKIRSAIHALVDSQMFSLKTIHPKHLLELGFTKTDLDKYYLFSYNIVLEDRQTKCDFSLI